MRRILFLVTILIVFFARVALGAFVVNGNGTVTDTSTGLMWQQETAGPMTWEAAIIYCEGLTLGGYDDWRLPNRNELQSLVDYSTCYPAIDTTAFPTAESSSYWWSSTTYAYRPYYAWLVYFYLGYVSLAPKSSDKDVRAVRSGQAGPFGNLVISVNDAVSSDPIEDANVTVGTRKGTTDPSGSVTFADLPLGVLYDIEITVAGYIPISDSIFISQADTIFLQYNLYPCELYFKDLDLDGYGLDNDSVCLDAPDPVSGYITVVPGDCDDTDPNTYPGAPELFDGKDNDCDGAIDENWTCEGDFDQDGDVDGSDLAVFATDFGRTGCPVSQPQSLRNENSLLKEEIEFLKAEIAILKKEAEKLAH